MRRSLLSARDIGTSHPSRRADRQVALRRRPRGHGSRDRCGGAGLLGFRGREPRAATRSAIRGRVRGRRAIC